MDFLYHLHNSLFQYALHYYKIGGAEHYQWNNGDPMIFGRYISGAPLDGEILAIRLTNKLIRDIQNTEDELENLK